MTENLSGKVMSEIPIDGMSVQTNRGKFQIHVEGAWGEERDNANRYLLVRLEGNSTHKFELIVAGPLLKVDHAEDHIEWVLDHLRVYLEQPEVPVLGKLELS